MPPFFVSFLHIPNSLQDQEYLPLIGICSFKFTSPLRKVNPEKTGTLGEHQQVPRVHVPQAPCVDLLSCSSLSRPLQTCARVPDVLCSRTSLQHYQYLLLTESLPKAGKHALGSLIFKSTTKQASSLDRTSHRQRCLTVLCLFIVLLTLLLFIELVVCFALDSVK